MLTTDGLLQTFDPKKRLTVDEALEHPYISAYVCLVGPISQVTADSISVISARS